MRSPAEYWQSTIPATSTTRCPSCVRTMHRAFTATVPSGAPFPVNRSCCGPVMAGTVRRLGKKRTGLGSHPRRGQATEISYWTGSPTAMSGGLDSWGFRTDRRSRTPTGLKSISLRCLPPDHLEALDGAEHKVAHLARLQGVDRNILVARPPWSGPPRNRWRFRESLALARISKAVPAGLLVVVIPRLQVARQHTRTRRSRLERRLGVLHRLPLGPEFI